jgi:hypothetical protein
MGAYGQSCSAARGGGLEVILRFWTEKNHLLVVFFRSSIEIPAAQICRFFA